MGRSSWPPGHLKSGGVASLDRTNLDVAPCGKAPRVVALAHRSSCKLPGNGATRAASPTDQTRDAIFLADAQARRIVDVNVTASLLTRYARSDLIEAPLSRLVAPEDQEAQRRRIAAYITQPSLISQIRYRDKTGNMIAVEIEQRRLEDGRILAVLRGASQRELVKGQFKQTLTRFALFVTTVDRKGRISYANPALCALSGWAAGDLIGRPVCELLPVGTLLGPDRPLSGELWVSDLEYAMTSELVTRSGSRRPVIVSALLLQDRAAVTLGAAIVGQDVTWDRAVQSELEQKLHERAELAAAIMRLRPAESAEATAQAICGELSGLDGVDFSGLLVFSAGGDAFMLAGNAPNDFPLSNGDHLPSARAAYLIERAAEGPWAERWRQRAEDGAYGEAMTQANVRSQSYAPIRYGDDPRGVLVVGSLNPENADAVIESLPAIAEFGSAASALLSLDLQAARLAAERHSRIKAVVDERAVHPGFQPIVDVNTRQVVRYEALTRFDDGVPPDTRFSNAWDVELGVELELVTLELAIRVGQDLPPDRWLTVYISPRLLTRIARLRSLLNEANRPLVLEVTEHEVISDYGAVHRALQELGPIRGAVHDAGAGTASLGHIVKLQPDVIKVDISLVRGVDADPARQAMVVALAHFARVTGCQLISEGVETRSEASTLNSLGGVDFAQGYWYGCPMNLASINADPASDLAPVV